MRSVARVISFLLHPVFMPSLGFLLVMGLDVEFLPYIGPETKRRVMYILILPFTVLFPLLYLALLKFTRQITSIQLNERSERIPVFISTLMFYLIGYGMARYLAILPNIYYSMMLGGIISLLCATIITFKWKISIHAIGITGVLGILCATGELLNHDYFFVLGENPVVRPIVNVALAAGVVCSARLALNVHSPSQVFTGAVVGFCSLYFPVKYLWLI